MTFNLANPMAVFANRPDPTIAMDFVCTLQGEVDFVDTEHPDHLDWRQAQLLIDTHEGRWMHFAILSKSGGRPIREIADSPIAQAQVAQILNRLFDAVHPFRPAFVLKFPDGIVSRFMISDEILTISFHVNAKSQRFIMGQSNHDWLRIQNTWKHIIKAETARRKKSVC